MDNKKSISELIKSYIKDRHINQSKLAEELGESSTNFIQKLRKKDLNVGYVMRISIILRHDFLSEFTRQYFDELRKYEIAGSFNEPRSVYGNKNNSSRDELYIKALEENVELLKQLNSMKTTTPVTYPSQKKTRKRSK